MSCETILYEKTEDLDKKGRNLCSQKHTFGGPLKTYHHVGTYATSKEGQSQK